jgi:hypothetical protein
MEKFVPEKEYVRPTIMQSLNWLIKTLDISGGKKGGKARRGL